MCNYSLTPYTVVIFAEKYMITNRNLHKDDIQISHLVHQVNFRSKPVGHLSSEGTERFSTVGHLQKYNQQNSNNLPSTCVCGFHGNFEAKLKESESVLVAVPLRISDQTMDTPLFILSLCCLLYLIKLFHSLKFGVSLVLSSVFLSEIP